MPCGSYAARWLCCREGTLSAVAYLDSSGCGCGCVGLVSGSDFAKGPPSLVKIAPSDALGVFALGFDAFEDACAISSGLAIRSPPRAWDKLRSPLMVLTAVKNERRLDYASW